MTAQLFDADPRFRTAPPASRSTGLCVVDSYTGFLWCAAGLHLLVPEAQDNRGGCAACKRRRKRQRNGNR